MRTQEIQNKIEDFAKQAPHRMIATKLEASNNGWPDMIFVVNSETFYFEIKNEDTKDRLSKIQKHKIAVINIKKQRAYTIETIDDFYNIINLVLKNVKK